MPTTVNSGSLNVQFLGKGGSLSSLGNPATLPATYSNNGTTLNYTGNTTSTDRNFTINTGVALSGAANIGVTTAATELTLSGAAVASWVWHRVDWSD